MENVGAPPVPKATNLHFFTPLLISMLGMLATLLALSAYHVMVKYCIRRQESARRLPLRPPLSVPASAGSLPAIGVDEKLLETIPIIAYESCNCDAFQAEQTECVVCLGDLLEGEMVRVLPNCQHAFHVPCIDRWFMGHINCPVCRSPLVAPLDDSSCSSEYDRESSLTVEVEILNQNPEGGDGEHVLVSGEVSGPRSGGLLRHCASLVLPWEKRPRRLVTGLKRSLSMDQSFVIIDIQREGDDRDSSSSSSSSSKEDEMRSKWFRGESNRNMDSISLKLMSNLSRLRVGRDRGILPY